MSASEELQKVVIDALKADADLAAVVGARIFDAVPQPTATPYIGLGPTQEITNDEEQIDGETHILQIDVWDRSGGSLRHAKRIAGLVKAVLHDAALVMPDRYALAFMRATETRAMLDADGLTAHGIVFLRAEIEL